MVVFGIDPGYAIVGWGAISFKSNSYKALGYGSVQTHANTDFNARLEYIYNEIYSILNRCRPDALAIERLYYQSNQKTVIKVAQARGVIILAAQKLKIPIFEYTPLQVKTAVTGYGKAKKLQVMEMTRRLLNLAEVPKPDDTAGSCIEVVEALREAGADVLGVVSIFTYGMQKGLDRLAAANVTNYSLSNFNTLCEVAVEEKYITPEEEIRLKKFMANPSDESWMA